MNAKKVYDNILFTAEKRPQKIETTKTTIAELVAITRKAPLYRDIQWTAEQQAAFDEFWLQNYGKKISNCWHKLYQAASGVFRVDYIPEMLYTTKIEPMLNDYNYAKTLEDKSIIESLSKDCGCVVPETVFVCSGGLFFDNCRRPISKEQAIERALSKKDLVIKPTIGSSSGKGVAFFSHSSEIEKTQLERLLEQAGKDYIVQGKIIPHLAYAAFNPTSINTVRIITFLAGNAIQHAPLAFRVGRVNKQVDNIHAGGIGVGINDDGMLLPCAYELGYGNKIIRHYVHPDSKVCFENSTLPGVAEIIRAAYAVHGRYPHVGIVSWDFTLDENENAVLIEANILGQGVWFPQMIHGKGLFGAQTGDILRLVRMRKTK